MAQFNYVKKGGGLGAVDAADSNSALSMLPSDADPKSGVSSMLSGTGTPAPSAGPQLPPSGGGELMDFSNALDEVINLARKKRNSDLINMREPARGTIAASDFSSILSNFNRASDKSSENLIKKVTDIQEQDIVTATDDNGNVSGIDKKTGEVIWTAKGVGNKQTGGAKDTSAKDEADDIASAIANFQGSLQGPNAFRGVSPAAYKYYKDELTRLYGAAAALKLDKAMQDAQNPQTPALPGLRVDYEN